MTKRPQTIQVFLPSGDLRGLTAEKSGESPACHVKPLSFFGAVSQCQRWFVLPLPHRSHASDDAALSV